MNDRTKTVLAIAGLAVVAYAVGYNHAQKRLFSELGASTAREAMIYLAAHDMHRFGR